MPGKARRRKGKYSPQSKRRKGRIVQPAAAVQQQPVTQVHEEPAPRSVPSQRPSTPLIKPDVVQYPFIAAELRTIGLLAVIMLAILIVLSFIPLPW